MIFVYSSRECKVGFTPGNNQCNCWYNSLETIGYDRDPIDIAKKFQRTIPRLRGVENLIVFQKMVTNKRTQPDFLKNLKMKPDLFLKWSKSRRWCFQSSLSVLSGRQDSFDETPGEYKTGQFWWNTRWIQDRTVLMKHQVNTTTGK